VVTIILKNNSVFLGIHRQMHNPLDKPTCYCGFIEIINRVSSLYIHRVPKLATPLQITHTQPFYCWSGICPGPPGSAGTRKVKPRRLKPIWWQWHLLGCMQVCTPCRQPRQHPTTQFFTGRMPFLTPSQQRQSTDARIHPYR